MIAFRPAMLALWHCIARHLCAFVALGSSTFVPTPYFATIVTGAMVMSMKAMKAMISKNFMPMQTMKRRQPMGSMKSKKPIKTVKSNHPMKTMKRKTPNKMRNVTELEEIR